jgi:hypothetical protein
MSTFILFCLDKAFFAGWQDESVFLGRVTAPYGVKINPSYWSIGPFPLFSHKFFTHHGTAKEIYRIILAPVFPFHGRFYRGDSS